MLSSDGKVFTAPVPSLGARLCYTHLLVTQNVDECPSLLEGINNKPSLSERPSHTMSITMNNYCSDKTGGPRYFINTARDESHQTFIYRDKLRGIL